MQYSPQIVELIEDKSHVFGLPDRLDGAAVGVAGSAANGAWVAFIARADGGLVRSLRYQVFGCPALIAACAYVAAAFEDRELTAIDTLNTAELMRCLQIPTEKAGKILVLQDALQNCRDRMLSV